MVMICLRNSLKCLKVEPFPSIIEYVPREIPRVLINNEPVVMYEEELDVVNGKLVDKSKERLSQKFKFGHFFNRRDVFVGGDIQDNIKKLIHLIGWDDELNELMNKNSIE